MSMQKPFVGFDKAQLDFYKRVVDWAAEKGRMEAPKNLTNDVCRGISYALLMLDPGEQEYLAFRFGEKKSDEEIASIWISNIIHVKKVAETTRQKLQVPCRWNYIRLGVVGYLQAVKADSETQGYNKGYEAGYKDGTQDAKDGVKPESLDEKILSMPRESMGLSNRALNALRQAGYMRIEDIAGVSEEEIFRLRGVGKGIADEIARKLQDSGIVKTDWRKYMLKI